MPSTTVIGGGLAGLACAATLAHNGESVRVLEKNEAVGGRMSVVEADGFVFDKGPSWYWMPDVFERFFSQFDASVSDFYDLQQLETAFRVYWGEQDYTDVPSDANAFRELFESLEAGSAKKLDDFMDTAKQQYAIGVQDVVYRPSLSISEYLSPSLIFKMFKYNAFGNFRKAVHSTVKNERLRAILEFPVLFLGATPERTPALYSMMCYGGLYLGTWYPKQGMYAVVEALKTLCAQGGVEMHTGAPVHEVEVSQNKVKSVQAGGRTFESDVFVGAADYRHVESLLPERQRQFTESYWKSKTYAPSCLLFYIGVSKRLSGLQHHNLFFDHQFDQHAREIYDAPAWPQKPLFYVCAPSVTDDTVAPEGHENLFVLMPLATSVQDTNEQREKYYDILMRRLEKLTGQSIREHVVYKKSYCIEDFKNDYNAAYGNAYGLANTLRQTAVLRPPLRSKKLSNLYFAGQLTVPGPGVPPALISGTIAAHEIQKHLRSRP